MDERLIRVTSFSGKQSIEKTFRVNLYDLAKRHARRDNETDGTDKGPVVNLSARLTALNRSDGRNRRRGVRAPRQPGAAEK